MTSLVKSTVFCLAAIVVAVPASGADLPPADLAPPAAGIRVLSAQYGNPGSGQLCNAMAPIAALCDGRGECTFDVRNTALCGDPSFLIIKQLNVSYTCGVGEYRTRISEYDHAVLACR